MFKNQNSIDMKMLLLACLLAGQTSVFAEGTGPCENNYIGNSGGVSSFRNINEVYSLEDFITKKILQESPINLLHASQKAKAWLSAIKPYQIIDPVYGVDKITIYPILSGGSPEAMALTEGRRIIGNLRSLEKVADDIKSSADGSPGGGKVIVLSGTSGTGKSEFPKVFGNVAKNLSRQNKSFHQYSYRFKNLHEVPGIRGFIRQRIIKDAKGNETMVPIKSAMNDSPFILLPAPVQKEILAESSEAVQAILGKNLSPKPYAGMDPETKFYIKEIVKHENIANDKKFDKNYMKALNKYVEVVRLDPSDSGIFTVIPNQGRDVDFASLIASKNIMTTAIAGPSHPLAYNYDGRMTQAHGGVLLLDELLRNDANFLDVLLTLFEERALQINGSSLIPIDALIMTATNTESIEKAIEEGGAIKAMKDRLATIPMPLSVVPQDIAKTILLMTAAKKDPSNFSIKALRNGSKEYTGEWEAFDLDKLYPLPSPKFVGDKPVLETPDHRYAIKVQTDGTEVSIPPHALKMISYILSATRQINDTGLAAKAGYDKLHTINKAVYKDPMERIRFFTGEVDKPKSIRSELKLLHAALKEGETGLSNRDANKWLLNTISRAVNSSKTTIGYGDIIAELREGVSNSDISVPGNDSKVRVLWEAYTERVAQHFIVPAIRNDIRMALNNGTNEVSDVYNQIVRELMQRNQDPEASTYFLDGGVSRTIDFKRLQEIEKLFLRVNNKQLNPANLISYLGTSGPSGKPWRELEAAVISYVDSNQINKSSFEEIYRYVQDGETRNSGTAEISGQFFQVMEEQFGYTQEAALEAMRFVKQYENKAMMMEQGR